MGKVVHQCKKYKKKISFSELIGNYIFLNYWHGFLVWMGWKSISVMVWNLLNKRDSRTNFAKYNKRDVTFIWQSRVSYFSKLLPSYLSCLYMAIWKCRNVTLSLNKIKIKWYSDNSTILDLGLEAMVWWCTLE